MSIEDADATRERTEAAKKRIAANEFMESVLYDIKSEADLSNTSTVYKVSASDIEFVPDAVEAISELGHKVEWDETSRRLSISWELEED